MCRATLSACPRAARMTAWRSSCKIPAASARSRPGPSCGLGRDLHIDIGMQVSLVPDSRLIEGAEATSISEGGLRLSNFRQRGRTRSGRFRRNGHPSRPPCRQELELGGDQQRVPHRFGPGSGTEILDDIGGSAGGAGAPKPIHEEICGRPGAAPWKCPGCRTPAGAVREEPAMPIPTPTGAATGVELTALRGKGRSLRGRFPGQRCRGGESPSRLAPACSPPGASLPAEGRVGRSRRLPVAAFCGTGARIRAAGAILRSAGLDRRGLR